jgi:hypothetical protein
MKEGLAMANSRAQVTFQRLIQDSQDYGSDDEHMVSRVFFDLEVEGQQYSGLYADIKQPVGASFESDPLEVSKPSGYEGPFNYEAFRDAAETYYRGIVGRGGHGIGIGVGSSVRMIHNTFNIPMVAEFDVDSGSGGW